jgi:hypothetical protein
MGSRFTRARRLSSWRRISLHMWGPPRDPTVYGNLEIKMPRALAYLEAANAAAPDARVTVTHLVAKAIAKAVAEHPDANAFIAGRRIYLRSGVDVYCQVATDGGRDLSGVKIADADRKSVIEIARELARRADGVRRHVDPGSERSKRIVMRVPHAWLGLLMRLIGYLTFDLRLDLSRFGIAYDQFGSAMVSNIGSFGLGVGHALAPLVPASRVPIVLLVGQVADKAIVDGGEVVAAPCMTVGATFDHRLIDGYQASSMAKSVIRAIEDPYRAFGLPSRSSSTDARFVMDWPDASGRDPHDSACKDRKPGFLREEDRLPPEESD